MLENYGALEASCPIVKDLREETELVWINPDRTTWA